MAERPGTQVGEDGAADRVLVGWAAPPRCLSLPPSPAPVVPPQLPNGHYRQVPVLRACQVCPTPSAYLPACPIVPRLSPPGLVARTAFFPTNYFLSLPPSVLVPASFSFPSFFISSSFPFCKCHLLASLLCFLLIFVVDDRAVGVNRKRALASNPPPSLLHNRRHFPLRKARNLGVCQRSRAPPTPHCSTT